MATISLRIDDDIRDELEEMADGEGVSVSELIRQAIGEKLAHDAQRTMSWSAPASLSKRDRLQLSLLYQIAQMVSQDEAEAEHYGQMVEILRNGHTGSYGEAFMGISDELSMEHCQLVWEILDMFRVIKATVDSVGIENIPGVSEAQASFSGFDHNDHLEAGMSLYAHQLVRNGKWQELAHHFDREHEWGNSHMPMLAVYRRMLDVFRPIFSAMVEGPARGRDGYLLTADEVAAVIAARRYPKDTVT